MTKWPRWWPAFLVGGLVLCVGLAQLLERATELNDSPTDGVQTVPQRSEAPLKANSETGESETQSTSLHNATTREWERLRQRLLNEIVPLLYASSDPHHLLVGAMLLDSELSRRAEVSSFLSLALSLAPEDPLLLSWMTQRCQNATPEKIAELEAPVDLGNLGVGRVFYPPVVQVDPLCYEADYARRGATLAGEKARNSAYFWHGLANRAKAGSDRQLEYLNHMRLAESYPPLEVKFLLMSEQVLGSYQDILAEDTKLASSAVPFGSTTLPVSDVCSRVNTSLERNQQACQWLADQWREGSYHERMYSLHLSWLLADGELQEHEVMQAAREYELVNAEMDVLLLDPDKPLLNDDFRRYRLFDAVKLHLIKAGKLEADDWQPKTLTELVETEGTRAN